MIEILSCGALATIQDLERLGFLDIGVGPAGAMDRLAVELGNMLIGNHRTAAVVENAAMPLRVRFGTATLFAITGATVSADLDGQAVWNNWANEAPAGSVLTIAPTRSGQWSYLAVSGGFDVPLVLGSASTDLKSQFGGLCGRPLEAGQRLARGETSVHSNAAFGVRGPEKIFPLRNNQVRAIPGRESDLFTRDSRDHFWSEPWLVTPRSNRIGYRLEGRALSLTRPVELLSYGLLRGIVQVPPSGQPIVQMSEANTCGGYPSIATVIGADLRRLAQLCPGATVEFIEVDRSTAIEALHQERAYLNEIRLGLNLRKQVQ